MSGGSAFACVCILFGLIICRPVFGLYEGDACKIKQSGVAGICRRIFDCPELEPTIRTRRPTTCMFDGNVPIVCCPNAIRTPVIASKTSVADMSISARKCIEYQSAVNVTTRYYVVGGGFVDKNEKVCSIDATPYIINGVETVPWEFPHMALLGYENKGNFQWACGGTLISEQYVLTAGHCTLTRYGAPTLVRLAMHSVSGNMGDHEERAQSFLVADIIKHPEYHRNISKYNDIALLRLEQPIKLTPYMRPACLPAAADDISRVQGAVASGWGITEYGGTLSDKLMKVRLDLYTATECNVTYTQLRLSKLARGVDADTQMCAGSRTERKDACQGDSGGPLQIQHPDDSVYCMYSILGIVSFGRGCGGVNTPGIYTRVLAFVPWIESVVWPQS